MTFQANIPLATDLISISQSDIKNNFTSLSTSWNVNHVDFNASGAGKHKFVSLPNQLVDPATAVSEVALYAKAVAAIPTLFLRKESNGSIIQMSGQDPIALTNGTTFLPGGIIIKWGQFSTNAGGTATPTFASAFPTNCFVVVTSVIDNGAPTIADSAVYAYNYSNGGFSATGTKRTTKAALALNASYIAIGN